MKKLILISFLIVTIFKINAQEHKEFYANGQLELVGNLENEIQIGEWRWYYENGQLTMIGNYTDGTQTGAWKSYHENGQLASIGNFADGNATGEHKSYYENGQLSVIGSYTNGRQTGEWKSYNDNGELMESEKFGEFVNGIYIWDEYLFLLTNGVHYGILKKSGAEVKFASKIIITENFIEIKSTSFTDNIFSIIIDEIGDMGGIKFRGYEGNINPNLAQSIILTMTKKNTFYAMIFSTKSGTYTVTIDTASKSAIEKGISESKNWEVKNYYDNGNLKEIGQKNNFGEKTGEWKFYYESGKLNEIENFADGKQTGEWKYYHNSGQLKIIAKYTEASTT